MLLWHSTDVGVSFQRFRDTVVAQTAAVLMNRGSSRAVHAVNDAPEEESYRDAIFRILDDSGGDQHKIEEQIFALQARRRRAGNRQPRPAPREKRRPPTGEARPRHCPNCGESHAAIKCPHPEVPKELCKCLICKKVGHSSRACSQRPAPGAVKSVEEEPTRLTISLVQDGFSQRRRAPGFGPQHAARPSGTSSPRTLSKLWAAKGPHEGTPSKLWAAMGPHYDQRRLRLQRL